MSKKNKSRFVLNIISVVLVCVIMYCGYRIWEINNNYVQEEKAHQGVMEFKPSSTDGGSKTADPAGPSATEVVLNPSIVEARNVNEDTLGWVEIPNTKIDYPFMQRKDNTYYLDHDFNGNKAAAGSIFMDYRCEKDFSGFNSIIYGHHMKNGSMFGTLKKFADRKFFNDNPGGKLYLIDNTYTLEIFAYMVVASDDQTIYNTLHNYDNNAEEYLEYVKDKARQYRDIGVTGTDRVVTLSTCGYEYENARLVLLARLK